MKKIVRLIFIQCMVIILFISQAYAFTIPFFENNNKDTVTESVEKVNKEKEKEEKKKQKEAEKKQKEEEKKKKEMEKNKDKDYLSVQTTISYKTNDEDKWTQKREFSKDETCFVKVYNVGVYDNFFGKPEDVDVIYRFSGFKNTDIIISEGNAELITNEKGLIEYKKTISTESKKEAEKEIKEKREKNVEKDINRIVFRYNPHSQDTIVLDVIYGDNIKSKFDAKSTLFFK